MEDHTQWNRFSIQFGWISYIKEFDLRNIIHLHGYRRFFLRCRTLFALVSSLLYQAENDESKC